MFRFRGLLQEAQRRLEPAKRIASALTLTLVILLMIFVEAFQSLASANPYDGTPVPPAFQMPNKDPPTVTIQSPLNATIYFENDVLLNFTVTKPASWFKPDVVCYIKNVTYQMDEGQAVVLYTPTPPTPPSELPATDQFSMFLDDVPNGQHTLQIKISAESQYLPNDTYIWFMVRHYPLRVSQTIVFSVENSPTPRPTPEPQQDAFLTTLVAAATGASATIIGLAVLLYFKKRER